MSWECAECRQKENEHIKINTVCHHCGKPLCENDRIEILDDAFDNSNGAVSNRAFHCRSCIKLYHS
jgi:hypothetical protein